MNDRIDSVISDLERTTNDFRSTFGGLSSEQLNWKPAPKSWSVAQCIDHLIVTHSQMFPILDRIAAGGARATFWEKYSPLTGFFGRFLIKGLDPANTKPMKTTSKAEPSASEIPGDIVGKYAEHQQEMIEHVRKLPRDIDPAKTIVTSPLLGFVTYSLDDWYTILTHHGRRHFNQAKRVAHTADFQNEAMLMGDQRSQHRLPRR
jgi:hypothetical protein